MNRHSKSLLAVGGLLQQVRANTVAALFHGHLAIPLIAAGLATSSLIAFGSGLTERRSVLLVFVAAAGAFAVYQLDSALGGGREDELNRASRLRWRRGKEPFLLASALAAAVVALFCCVFVFPHLQLVALALGLAGLSYVLPVLPGVGRIRSVWFMKPVTVAAAWAVGTVLIPLVGASVDVAPSGLLALVTYRFLFLLPNAIASDLGDAPGDLSAGHDTVATRYGRRQLLHFCAVVALIPALGLVIMGPVMPTRWILLEAVGLGLSAWAIRVVPEGTGNYPVRGASAGPEEYRCRIDGALLWYLPAALLLY